MDTLGNVLVFEPGSVIFREGEAGTCAYLIKDGKVDISVRNRNGRVFVARLGKGEVFGELALVDGHPRSASATTTIGCEVHLMTSRVLGRELAALDPFMRFWVQHMTDRIRLSLRRMDNLPAGAPRRLPCAGEKPGGGVDGAIIDALERYYSKGGAPAEAVGDGAGRRVGPAAGAASDAGGPGGPGGPGDSGGRDDGDDEDDDDRPPLRPAVRMIGLARRLLEDGDLLFREGDVGGEAFIVRKGRIRIFKGDLEQPVVLAEVLEGQIFGELALIDGKPRNAGALAVGPTELLTVDALRFRQRIERCSRFMQLWIRTLTDRLRRMSERIHT